MQRTKQHEASMRGEIRIVLGCRQLPSADKARWRIRRRRGQGVRERFEVGPGLQREHWGPAGRGRGGHPPHRRPGVGRLPAVGSADRRRAGGLPGGRRQQPGYPGGQPATGQRSYAGRGNTSLKAWRPLELSIAFLGGLWLLRRLKRIWILSRITVLFFCFCAASGLCVRCI